MTGQHRRLAAILVADVVGFSRAMGADEASTLAAVGALKREVIEPAIAAHAGRLFKAVGDGFLVEFASAVQAVMCALAIQGANAGRPLTLRIGVHLGDVVVEGDDLMGDGVNVAARIESVADAGGIAISRQVYDQVRDRVEAMFDDKGEVVLKNIARPVHVFAIGVAGPTEAPTLALPDRPSIAVLPFQNMSGDPEQEYFADGMVEDIITALSRFRSLFVIARNSSFAYKGQSPDIRRVGRELGVRYVLEGSVRRAGQRVRITGQLIDAAGGTHLWADRFEGALEDLFELQDRVSESVVGRIVPALDRAEIERARRKPPGNLDAYDCYLRGRDRLRDLSPEAQDEALALFRRAVDLDPAFAAPHGMIARVYSLRRMQMRVADRAHEEAETRRSALRVRELGSDDALALGHAGHALFTTCNEPELGAALVDRALTINPSQMSAWVQRAWISMVQGDQERSVAEAGRALRLSPLQADAIANCEGAIAYARYLQGRYAEAWQAASRAMLHWPDWVVLLQIDAAIAAMAGRADDAAAAMARLRAQAPLLRISNINQVRLMQRRADAERMVEGLRRAGLPE